RSSDGDGAPFAASFWCSVLSPCVAARLPSKQHVIAAAAAATDFTYHRSSINVQINNRLFVVIVFKTQVPSYAYYQVSGITVAFRNTSWLRASALESSESAWL